MEKLKNEDLERKSLAEFKDAKKMPLIVVLDNVRSALNVGSVFRTSDAFMVRKIYLCGITAKPPSKEIRKTALGADESVEWEYVEDANNLVSGLKGSGNRVIAVEQVKGARSLADLEVFKDQTIVFVFGHEVNGVSQEIVDLADECVEIPQYGTKHSLNVSVSVGVVLWEAVRKMV
ncbi:MAG: RNA methyltransferase [Bacteroidia bacterium]|nr:RNA methyltransferase [Bacteroidia bacterium]